jgi:hypothetical protein
METILVSKTEWEELVQLRNDLPTLLEKARKEAMNERLTQLHSKERENPEKRRQYAKQHYKSNREEILAKRREAYKRKTIQEAQ